MPSIDIIHFPNNFNNVIQTSSPYNTHMSYQESPLLVASHDLSRTLGENSYALLKFNLQDRSFLDLKASFSKQSIKSKSLTNT